MCDAFDELVADELTDEDNQQNNEGADESDVILETVIATGNGQTT